MLAHFTYVKPNNDESNRVVFVIEDTDEHLKGIDITSEESLRQKELDDLLTGDTEKVIEVLGLMKSFRCFKKDRVVDTIHYSR